MELSMNILTRARNYRLLGAYAYFFGTLFFQGMSAMEYNWEQPFQKTIALEGHENRIFINKISVDGTHIITADSTDVVKIWDAHLGICLQTINPLHPENENLKDVCISPDNSTLALVNATDTVYDHITLWDTETGKCINSIVSKSDSSVDQIYFSALPSTPKNIPCLIMGTQGGVFCYDYQGSLLYAFNTKNMSDLASSTLNPTHHMLALGYGMSQETHVYDLVSHDCIARCETPEKNCMPLCIFGKLHPILALVCNNAAASWDIPSKKILKNIETSSVTQQKEIFYSELSHDDSHLILYSFDNKFLIWNIEKKCCIASIKNPFNESFLKLSPCNNYGILLSPRENRLQLINLTTMSSVQTYTAPTRAYPHVTSPLSESGKFMVLTDGSTATVNFFNKKLPSRTLLSKLYDTSIQVE